MYETGLVCRFFICRVLSSPRQCKRTSIHFLEGDLSFLTAATKPCAADERSKKVEILPVIRTCRYWTVTYDQVEAQR